MTRHYPLSEQHCSGRPLSKFVALSLRQRYHHLNINGGFEMQDYSGGVLSTTLLVVLAALHPFAAAGAAVGCCFYLAFPSRSKGFQRLLYAVFSWGIGYAAGIYLHGEGPPFSEKAMLVSAAASAFAVLVFVALGSVIHRNESLPNWLVQAFDLFFKSKRGGRSDD